MKKLVSVFIAVDLTEIIFLNDISTRHLTVLTMCVIVLVEQEKVIILTLSGGGIAMNINKFTQKSMQAVQECERAALEYGNQEDILY